MTNLIKDRITQRKSVVFEPKFYIKDSNGKWVDFSNKSGVFGLDRLSSIGTVSNKIEKDFGFLVTTIQNVTLRNNDGFFNKPLRSDLIKTVSGEAAVFNASKNKKLPVLKGQECKVTVRFGIPNKTESSGTNLQIDSLVEEELGYFYIDDVIPNFKKNIVSLKLISKEARLNKKDAESIKDGYDFYSYRPINYLITKILESEFGVLPDSYSIDSTPSILTTDGRNVLSNLGRPPIYDGTTYYSPSGYCRALKFANINSGGMKLYLGIDDVLWTYDPDTAIYTSISTIGTSGYPIKHIDYDPETDVLIIISSEDEYWPNISGMGAWTGWDTDLFFYDGSTVSSPVSTTWCSYDTIFRIRNSAYEATPTPASSLVYVGNVANKNTTSYGSGPNLYVPYSQEFEFHNANTAVGGASVSIGSKGKPGAEIYEELSGDLGTHYSTSDDNQHIWIPGGMIALQEEVTSYTLGLGGAIKYEVGQKKCIIIGNQDILTHRYMYYWSFIPDTTYPRIYGYTSNWSRLNIMRIDGTHVYYTQDHTSSPAQYPLCMSVNGTSDRAYVFMGRCQTGTGSANYADMEAYYIDLTKTTNPLTACATSNKTSGETGDDQYNIIISVEFFPTNSLDADGNEAAIVIWFNQSTGLYSIGYVTVYDIDNSNTLFSDTTILYSSINSITGLSHDGTVDEIFFFTSGEGRIYKISMDGIVPSVLTRLNNIPGSTHEYTILSGILAVDPDRGSDENIFGVSSPTTRLEAAATYIKGNYNLFRLHKSMANIIQYADFEGLSKLEAIKDLAQAFDQLAYFNRHGDFKTITRAHSFGTGDANFIIGDLNAQYNDGTLFIEASLDLGLGSIYNVAKIDVYDVIFVPPASNALTLIDRSEVSSGAIASNNITFVDYSIEQKDTERKRVLAYCIRPGTTLDGNSRWKYLIYRSEIEAYVAADYSTTGSNVTLYLRSLFGGNSYDAGIHTGDFIQVADAETGEYISRRVNALGSNYLTLSSDIGIDVKNGTLIKVQKIPYVTTTYSISSSLWSDEGVGIVGANEAANAVPGTSTVEMESAYPFIGKGTVLKFGNQLHEYRVIEKDLNGVDVIIETANGPIGEGLQESVSAGDLIRAWYSPGGAEDSTKILYTSVWEIGGTNIFIKWYAGAGEYGVDYSNDFFQGDRLIVDCPGKVLEKQSGGTQIFVDGNSMEIYEKQEYSMDNRFIDREMANEITRRIIANYADPKFILKITIPMLPYIDIVNNSGTLTEIDIVSQLYFPTSEDFTERFNIREISHDLKLFTTTLMLISTEAY